MLSKNLFFLMPKFDFIHSFLDQAAILAIGISIIEIRESFNFEETLLLIILSM